MFRRIHVIGRGRVGGAVAARLEAAGRLGGPDGADLVLICVPDAAIAGVAAQLPLGPWVAHVSGATPLSALDPHTRRFGLHPLQTFVRARGPEQLDGAFAAVTAEGGEARRAGHELAALLELRAFDLDDERRALYHAGATLASPLFVTLYRAAARALETAGAPPEALLPLVQRTIDNRFELTGPAVRGDRATIEAHERALESALPEVLALYRALSRTTLS